MAGGPAGTGRDAGAATAAPSASAELALSPAPPLLRTWQALAVAALGGLVLCGAFPPAGFWPLAVVGPALLVIALWGRSLRGSFVVGLVFGITFFFPLLSWVLNVAWYAWTALAGAEAVVLAALAVGQRLLLRLPAWPLAVAGWWVAAEAVRDRWPFAFPWGRLGISQAGAPTAGWVAAGGPVLLTFLVALAGACLAWLVVGARSPAPRAVRAARPSQPAETAEPARPAQLAAARPALRRRLLPLGCLIAATGVALAGPLLAVGGAPAGTPTASVAAIQGNVPHARSLPSLLRENTVTLNHANATLRLAGRLHAAGRPAPDVVIWPENSTDQDPRRNPFIYSTIQAAVNGIGAPVLVGAVLQDPVRNAGQLWLPRHGPAGTYIKRQLVPFGEVIPWRSFLNTFTSLPALQPVNFTAGHRPVVFHLGKVRLGDVICYEVGFDGLVSSEVAAGANLLTVQTNDADFELDGQTGETLQQLAMARIRAVEHDRSVVVASTTGVSAIIAPDGHLIAHTPTWRQAIIQARVPLRTDTTLADRLGGWPEAVLTAATIAALGWAIASALRARRRRDAEPAGDAE
jgi:apolipoprotein N-acyltransferase